MVMEEQRSDVELDSERVPVPQVQGQQRRSVNEERPGPVDGKPGNVPRNKPRLRKKALHAAILKQMEFYFSDANLRRDRFLSRLIREDDPYVDLDVFLTFNKIKELTSDAGRIAKALRGSTILSLSEDETKVRRVAPIVSKEKPDADDCTVYAQNLPLDADHETLRSVFSPYGNVVYISVPRFRNNRKIKGFAFVEFDAPESAEKCLKAFRKKGCVLPSYTAPEDLLSVTTFDEPEKDVTRRLGALNELQTESETKEQAGNNAEEQVDIQLDEGTKGDEVNEQTGIHLDEGNTGASEDRNNLQEKRKREGSEFSEDEQRQENEQIRKKKKMKRVSDENEDPVASNNERTATEDEDTAAGTEDERKRKKKKRQKRKKRGKTEDFHRSSGLQVMAKSDWKRLRNKYLELQRNKMKQLKQHLRRSRWSQWSSRERNRVEKEEGGEEKDSQGDATAPRFSFVPGVIVRIEMDKPCTDPKSLKMELRNRNNAVKYIDVEDGSYVAHARCDTNEAARALVRRFKDEEEEEGDEKRVAILEGEEEKLYWEKILSDREEKLTKKVRPKRRGRNKLLKKAEKELGKHIKFDEV